MSFVSLAQEPAQHAQYLKWLLGTLCGVLYYALMASLTHLTLKCSKNKVYLARDRKGQIEYT